MKTLILYATKHGSTKEIAERISKRIPNSMICDLKSSSIPSISQFDCVILGSSIYAGTILKEAKTFLAQNTDAMCHKQLGLFLSGMDVSRETEFFSSNFSNEILQAATAKSLLGGIFDPQKTNFIERLIMKIVAKQSTYTDTILDDKIEQFTEVMKR